MTLIHMQARSSASRIHRVVDTIVVSLRITTQHDLEYALEQHVAYGSP